MANCKGCLFYSAEQDQLRQDFNDALQVGVDLDEQHFCDRFSPIPDGVFEGEKECTEYLPKDSI